jgi:hypothetical protein
MLDAKWDLDEESGRGFKANSNNQISMFDEISAVDYSSMVKDFIKEKGHVTNQQLFDFGLENGFLPKHTKKVLDELKKNNLLELSSSDGDAIRGYYIEDEHNRKIKIKMV